MNGAVLTLNCLAFAAALLGLFLLCHEHTIVGAWLVALLYLLSRRLLKYVTPGTTVAKVVGDQPLDHREGGYLLED